MLRPTVAILIILFVGFYSGAEARMYIVDDDGFAQYNTIGEAVDASNSGDMIYVKAGIYREHLVVDKTLTIMPPVGEEDPTVLEGDGSEIGIDVQAEGCRIEGLTIKNFRGPGIRVESDGNEIRGNVFEDNVHGIFLNQSSQNTVGDNLERGGYCGIVFLDSSDNAITGNLAEGCGLAGTLLNNSQNNVIKDSKAVECDRGIYLITESNNNLVRGCTVLDCGSGIVMERLARENGVEGCRVENATITGIGMVSCVGNSVHDNQILNSENGITLFSSDGNVIQGNILENVSSGLMFYLSPSNTLASNRIAGAKNGITIKDSPHNVVEKNILGDVTWAFYVDGNSEESFDCQVSESNLVDGKPILYYYRRSDLDVTDQECAHLALAYCRNGLVKNSTVSNDALFVYSSMGNLIQESNVSGCYGMRIYNSSNNQILGNRACNNKFNGILLVESASNTIANNFLCENKLGGLSFDRGSDENEIIGNTFSNNQIGIGLNGSNENAIYHNNFIDNAEQASDDGENLWDWGPLKGGNYWSDHECEGNPCQNSPRAIGNIATDYYPFQDKDGWV